MSVEDGIKVVRLASIQVGLPRTYGVAGAADPMDRPWTTAFFKEPVDGPVWLGRLNLEGDRQADPRYHGGPDKAVMAYAAAHYPLWRAEVGTAEMGPGGFGENFTVEGADEASVCIGDVYAIGDARVQVSQPRAPCWKVARRWRVKDLSARVQRTGRTGWYLRVLEEGRVAPGDALELLERPHPEWSVARANAALYGKPSNVAEMLELSRVDALSAGTRGWVEYRAAGRHSDEERLVGENA